MLTFYRSRVATSTTLKTEPPRDAFGLCAFTLSRKDFPKLGQFRCDDKGAIALEGMLLEVILVIVFRLVIRFHRAEFRHDRRIPYQRHFGDDMAGSVMLHRRVVVNH